MQADALFPFDKSAPESMLPDARAQLDRIAERIRKHEQVSAITIVGHTDRLGPESINGPLSLARANTVRAYLVAHGLEEHHSRERRGDPASRERTVRMATLAR